MRRSCIGIATIDVWEDFQDLRIVHVFMFSFARVRFSCFMFFMRRTIPNPIDPSPGTPIEEVRNASALEVVGFVGVVQQSAVGASPRCKRVEPHACHHISAHADANNESRCPNPGRRCSRSHGDIFLRSAAISFALWRIFSNRPIAVVVVFGSSCIALVIWTE